ncbi:MAG: hypothetical protein II797_03370, partial [Clostridia bacterium]|nr:hypothetical protein [Clostridia bacterium]
KVEGYEIAFEDELYRGSYISFSGEAVAKGKDKGTYYMDLADTQFMNTNANFDVTFEVTDGAIQITKRTLIIRADHKQKTYGENDPELTYTAIGLANGEKIPADQVILSRDPGEDVGIYPIHVQISQADGSKAAAGRTGGNRRGAIAPAAKDLMVRRDAALRDEEPSFDPRNYDIQVEESELEIIPREVVVKANNIKKKVGETDPELTVTITGLAEGDDPSMISYDISRKAGEAAGKYPITVTGDEYQGGPNNNNYHVTFLPGIFIIKDKKQENDDDLGNFSLFFLTDQNLDGEEGKRADTFKEEIKWMKEHAKANGAFAIVNSGNLVDKPDNEAAWKLAKDTLKKLPNSLPYFDVAGFNEVNGDEMNYDAYIEQDLADTNKRNEYEDGQIWFQPFSKQQLLLVGIGHQKIAETDEEKELQEKWLEFVNKKIAQYPYYSVILLVNDFIEPDAASLKDEGKLTAFGELLEQEVVAKNSNVRLVLCGNAQGTARWEKSYNGRKVNAVMFNYSADEENGTGFFRIITFNDVSRKITVSTYSPVLDKDTYDEKYPERDRYYLYAGF